MGAQHSSARERNRDLFDGPFGAVYSFYTERRWLSPVVARVVWGSDLRPFYESLAVVASAQDGALIIDAPCGAGVALRHLGPEQSVRYLAVDISQAMLERTRRRALAAGLGQIEVVEADAAAIPAPDGSAELFLSYFGLHCFEDPRAALAEAGRCLQPGGRLVGSAIVPSSTARGRLLVRPRRGGFGRLASADEIGAWLGEIGFESLELKRCGLFAYFSARKPRRASQ